MSGFNYFKKPESKEEMAEIRGNVILVSPVNQGDKLADFVRGQWVFTEVGYDERTGMLTGKLEKAWLKRKSAQ